METLAKSLLNIHILAGSISLFLFWIPAFSRKGGKTHNLAGHYYVVCMWLVVVTAMILSVINLVEEDYFMAGFLGYLSILTSAPLWYARAILKNKKRISNTYYYTFRALYWVIFLFALSLIVWSVVLEVQGPAVLMLIFGILGLTSFGNAAANYQQLTRRSNWIVTHLRGMFTTGIAAYTAFFAFGGRRFLGDILTDHWMVIPWVLPTIIGTLAIRYFTRKYTVARTQNLKVL